MKILWADDQVDVAKTFAQSLLPQQAKIDFAGSGEEALEKLTTQQFDIVLLDLAMPPGQWGGLWLLERLLPLIGKPPVIVVSGEGSQAETIKALRLGAADYVLKERLGEELNERIGSALEASATARRVEQQIAAGESDRLEFKATLRINLHTQEPDPQIELAVLKTIGAFLNSDGGTLLIGVADSGGVTGIEADRFESIDKFQLHFWTIFRESVGPEYSEFVKTTVCEIGEATIFCVACAASNRPAYVKAKPKGGATAQELFFVRAGPQTEMLGLKQALAYIGDHFRKA